MTDAPEGASFSEPTSAPIQPIDATLEGISVREPEPVIETLDGGMGFQFSWWDTHSVMVQATHIVEHSRGEIDAEITVHARTMLSDGPLYLADLKLKSAPARRTFAKELEARYANTPWAELLDRVCQEAVWRFRAGVPAEELEPSDEPVQFAVDKLLVRDEINELYADGGQFKTWHALLLALSITQGLTLPCGLTPRVRGPVLYVDAETSKATFERRLAALMRGLSLSPSTRSRIHYYRLDRPLVDSVGTVRAEALRLHAVLIIVDSFSWAIGTASVMDAASPFMNALRRLPATKLVTNHVAKAFADQKGRTRALGPVAMMNGPRNAWELKSSAQDQTGRTVGFFHTKHNDTRELSPFTLRWTFTESAVGLVTAMCSAGGDVTDKPELATHLSLPDQILGALSRGGLTVKILAEIIGANEGSIRARLNEMLRDKRVMKLPEIRNGSGVWGLPHV